MLASERAWPTELNGDLQMHSRWSDGLGSIREMADAAIERGYEYIAITDHSKGLKIAGGIDEEQVAQQAVEIRAINESLQQENRRIRVVVRQNSVRQRFQQDTGLPSTGEMR